MSDNLDRGITPFVFADPSGRRWPRLRHDSARRVGDCVRRRRLVCPHAFCDAAVAAAVATAAVERAAEIAPKSQSGDDSGAASHSALAKIRRGAQSAEEGDSGSPAPAFPAKTGHARSASRFLPKRRSLQLRLARAARRSDHACLSGMDDGGQRHGRSANRSRHASPETHCRARHRAHAAPDQPTRRHLAARGDRESGERRGAAAAEIFSATFSPLCGTRKPPGW